MDVTDSREAAPGWPKFQPGEPCPECGNAMHGYPCIHHKEGCSILKTVRREARPTPVEPAGVHHCCSGCDSGGHCTHGVLPNELPLDPAHYRPDHPGDCGWIGVLGWLDNLPSEHPCNLPDTHEGPHERRPTPVEPEARLRDAYQWIFREDDDHHQADNACAECVPDSPILIEGFRCIPHQARAYLGFGSFTSLRRLAVEPDALPLDVPRLARALHALSWPEDHEHPEFNVRDDVPCWETAQRIASEYARLGPSEDKP